MLALKMRCNKLHARFMTRQGRRPQARSVKVGTVGNGILVKKNLTGELWQRAVSMSVRREAASSENTACARGVLRKVQDMATSK